MNKKSFPFLIFLLVALLATDANAWFFFIPGALLSKIGDGLSGAEGENCVSEKARVGDVLKSGTGHSATIKSLSGTSSRCQDSTRPIRALIVYSFDYKSSANFNIPDEFQAKDLTDFQKYLGILVMSASADQRRGVTVLSRRREIGSDGTAVARLIEQNIMNVIEEARTANAEKVRVKNMDAWRFEVTGKNKGIFGQKNTYLVTVIEGEQEYLTINAWARSDDYDKEKEGFKKISETVVGIDQVSTAKAEPVKNNTIQLTVDHAKLQDSTAYPSSIPTPTPTASSPSVSPSPPSSASTTLSQSESSKRLMELHKLYKDGIISQVDFEAKKQEILKSM